MTIFSRRTPGSFLPNRLAARSRALREAGVPCIDLTLSNPTAAQIAYPEEEILDALHDRRALRYEPDPKGSEEARRAIAAWHIRHGARIDAGHLVLASSTSEAYSWLFRLLCDPGAAVMVPRPSYPLFECLAELESVRAVAYPLVEEWAWRIDLASLEAQLDPQARAIVIVNPNNPTGNYIHPEDWLHIQELAAMRGLAVIADEVFFDYAWTAAPRQSALAGPQLALTFTLSGLSKTAGLPQMKLGWIHVAGPEDLRREALERLEWIADAYLPASAPVQLAVPRWLELAPLIQARILSRVLSNREELIAHFGPQSSWRVLPAAGGWTAIVEAPRIHSAEEWALRFLHEAFVLVQPGYFYDFDREALLALSLLPPPEQFGEALVRLEKIFRSV